MVHNRLQRRRLILNFARDREGDSSGETEIEHQEQDVFFVPACTSHHSKFRKFGRSGRGVRSPSLRDEVNPEVHAWWHIVGP